MDYRRYHDDDLASVVDTFLAAFSGEPWNDRWPSREHLRTYLLEIVSMPTFRWYVVGDGNAVIGASLGHLRSWWEGTECLIDEFFVSPRFQGGGIGSALLDHVKRELKKEGVSALVLLTKRDCPAEQFYLRHGFEDDESLVFMSCRL
ncbi:MAG TPA: N-acetyltransferase [Methanomicrobia archaeon]|nr:N-acetyltransferase [Methanomicrobia archaeon]